MKNISEKIYQILDTPKNFWERILRGIIFAIGGALGVVFVFAFVWIFWIFFGN